MKKAIGIILILLGIASAVLGGTLALKNRHGSKENVKGVESLVGEVKQEYKRSQDEQDVGFLLLLGGTISFVVGIILTASGSNKQIIIMGANGEVVEQKKIKRKLQNNKKNDNIIEPITAREVILNLNKIDGLYETKIIDSIEYQKRRNDVKEKIIINGITEDIDEFILQIKDKLTDEEVKGIFNVLKVSGQETVKEKKKEKIVIEKENNKREISIDEVIEIVTVAYKMKNVGAIEENEYNERKNKLKVKLLENGVIGDSEEFVLELRAKIDEEILTNKEINQIFKVLQREILINEKINDGYEIIKKLQMNKNLFISKIINEDEYLKRKDEIIKYFIEKCKIQKLNEVINVLCSGIDSQLIDKEEIKTIWKYLIKEKKEEVVLKLDFKMGVFIGRIQCFYILWEKGIIEKEDIKNLYIQLIEKFKLQKFEVNLKEDLENIEKLFLNIKLDEVLNEQEIKEALKYKAELQSENIDKLICKCLDEKKNEKEFEVKIIISEIEYRKSKENKIEDLEKILLKTDEEILTIYENDKNYFAKRYLEFKYRNLNDILDMKKIYKKNNKEIINELQKNKKEFLDKYDKEKKEKRRKTVKIAIGIATILVIIGGIREAYIRRLPSDNHLLKEIENYYNQNGERLVKLEIEKKQKLNGELVVEINGKSTTDLYEKILKTDIIYNHNGEMWALKEERNKKEDYIPKRELSDREIVELLEKEYLEGKNGRIEIENMKIERIDSFEDGIQKIRCSKEALNRDIEIEGELKFIAEKWKIENLVIVKDKINEALTEKDIEKLKKDFIKGENLIETNRIFKVIDKKLEDDKIVITINEVYNNLMEGKIKNTTYEAEYGYDKNGIIYKESKIIDESEEMSKPSNEKLIELMKLSDIIDRTIFTWDKATYSISNIKYDQKSKEITAKINGKSDDMFSTKSKISVEVQYKFEQEWKLENIEYKD